MTRWPSVIAHRGASGYLPEHTRAAKVLAFGMGADYLEQDVVASRDGELFVLHDIHLNDVTDVALRYPSRRRSDGRFYALDFAAAELRTLRVSERRDGPRPAFADRFRASGHEFRLMTLDEELDLVADLNRTTGRTVGVYPEIKRPDWHREHGIDLGASVLRCLSAHGYDAPGDRVMLQCFDHGELVRLRDSLGTALPLVQLLDDSAEHDELASQLDRLVGMVQAIGPSCQRVWNSETGGDRGLARRAQAAGLLVHPYTFRRENLPSFAPDLESLLRLFMGRFQVDGVFCDFPDVAVQVRAQLNAKA